MNRQNGRSSATPFVKTPTDSREPTASVFFETALRLSRAGQLAESESCCRRALAVDPDHADSLHLMGMLLPCTPDYRWLLESVG
jgi:hypothetical protein